MKTCTRCKESKPRSEFYRSASRADGLSPWCKRCESAKAAARYVAKKDEIDAHNRAYNAAHAPERAACNERWRRENRGRVAAVNAAWYAANKASAMAKALPYQRKRRRENPQVRLAECLRARLREILGGAKTGSAVSDLGCSLADLQLHLERQWSPGMTWENYGCGPGCWSVDHVRPLARFDLLGRAQFLAACHYTNLQPMWHVDNLRKGAKLVA